MNAGAASKNLLPEGRLAGPMPWVIAIMMFLTVLAAATGLGLGGAARALGDDLRGKVTIQLVEADPVARQEQADAVERMLARDSRVSRVERLADAELAALLAPWIGVEALAADEAPIPAMIDATVRDGSPAALASLSMDIVRVAPSARLDAHSSWLAPVGGLIAWLRLLSVGLVVLMAIATAASVVLAARAALDTHRATIDVLHLMGATDHQIARLFQRRIALDALFGSLLGLAGGATVAWMLGQQLAALGSELIGQAALGWSGWSAIVALPLAGTLLAMVAARYTVLSTLRTML